jgi:uncharacterized protein (TIGR02118 family)
LTLPGSAHSVRLTTRDEEVRMIHVSVLCPSAEGKRFDDVDHFAKKHMALGRQRLGGLGLRRLEVDAGVIGGSPGSSVPYACIGHLYLDSEDAFRSAMSAHGKELVADVPNFTNIQPSSRSAG